jgi:hypothetical protein
MHRFAALAAPEVSNDTVDHQVPLSRGPPSSPWLFLEPKSRTYQPDMISRIWQTVTELKLDKHVALWAMDTTHYDILTVATGGNVRIIWSYMDREFSDQISTVPYPSPIPPRIPVLFFNQVYATRR